MTNHKIGIGLEVNKISVQSLDFFHVFVGEILLSNEQLKCKKFVKMSLILIMLIVVDLKHL